MSRIANAYATAGLCFGRTTPETPSLTVVASPPVSFVIVGVPNAAASLGTMPAGSKRAG